MESNTHFPHVRALDGLRGIAVIMVMLFHFIGSHGEPAWVRKAAIFGQTGVDLFFVLSGYLITSILLRTRSSPNYFKAFYGRRTLRIFPLYFLALCIHFLLDPLISGKAVAPFSQQVWSWFFLENVPATFTSIPTAGPIHFWSLAVEEHFYLLWPLIVLKTKRESLLKVIAVILIAAPCLRVVLQSCGAGSYYLTPARMDSLAWGALLAVSSSGAALAMFRRPLFSAMVVAASLIPLFLIFSGQSNTWMQGPKLTLIALFYTFMIASVPGHPVIGRLLEFPLFTFTGRISYGLYVFHEPVFARLFDTWRPAHFIWDLAVAFICSFGVAFLSFRCFESFFLARKHWFPYQERGVPAGEPSNLSNNHGRSMHHDSCL